MGSSHDPRESEQPKRTRLSGTSSSEEDSGGLSIRLEEVDPEVRTQTNIEDPVKLEGTWVRVEAGALGRIPPEDRAEVEERGFSHGFVQGLPEQGAIVRLTD